ncbi:MAG: phenylpyruvate tautomerase MIF-related protein [Oscillospiraceae bacterium]
MPFINVKTNVSVAADKQESLKSDLGKAISAIPGKSENWLMVGIEPEHILYFQGSDEPAAMVEVSIYGKADSSSLNALTAEICKIVNDNLGISPSRTYVKYMQTPDWGWNGGNF